MDCSLNGDCVDGVCHCDAPWSGGTCETMRFLPVQKTQGYGMQPNLTTWGGGAIYDGSLYHLFVSAMTNDCPLSTWTKNSRIDHAVANDVAGPYKFQDVAVNTWAHNAAPVTLKDGSYAIFHIGNGDGAPDGGQNCSSGVIEPEPMSAAAGSTIHVSDSLEGPWTPLSPNTLGGCNNPAPWVHQNGTIYIVCNGSLKRADDIHGPWTDVTSFSHDGGPEGNYEDPVLYTDKRGWHVFYHVYNYADRDSCVEATVSAHVFSEDGYTWKASPTQPFGTQIEVEGGETITVSTRERPKLFFNEQGQMTHLFNGVCYAEKCPSEKPCVDCKYTHWDYTLAQPLDLSPPTPAPFPSAHLTV